MNVESVQDKGVCSTGKVAIGSLHTKYNQCLRQNESKKKRNIFEHFSGNIPKDETIAEISQGILVWARVCSEE